MEPSGVHTPDSFSALDQARARVSRLASDPVFRRRAGLAALALIVLSFVGWRSLNGVPQSEASFDSGVFASGAMHLLDGRILYKDLWDHKQPVIYAIDALGILLGGPTLDSVRTVERAFTVAGCLFVFMFVRKVFGRFALALVAAIAFPLVLHFKTIFQGGNLTEEYAAIFVLGGILASAISRASSGARAHAASALSGLMFSLAAFTKEPFLLSSVPWFLYLVFRADTPFASALKRAGSFLLGVAIPAVCIAVYLFAHGAWRDWFDATISYNLVYTRHISSGMTTRAFSESAHDLDSLLRFAKRTPFGPHLTGCLIAIMSRVVMPTWTGEVLLFAGLVAALRLRFSARYGHVPRVLVGALACEGVGVLISSVPDAHYCIQLVPVFVLVCASGGAFLLDATRRLGRGSIPAVVALALLLVAMDFRTLESFARDVARPAGKTEIRPESRYVRDHTSEGDFVWAGVSGHPLLYLETGRLSPTRYFYAFEHLFLDTTRVSAVERVERLKADLKKHPPKFILLPLRSFLDRQGIMPWILENYALVPTAEAGGFEDLWVRRETKRSSTNGKPASP